MKILFRLSLTLLLFNVVYLIIMNSLSLEYITFEMNELDEQYIFFSFPLFFLLFFISTIKRNEYRGWTVLRIMGGFLVGFLFMITMVILTFSDWCAYNTFKTLAVYKTDTTRKLVLRDFGCGATDSSPASFHTFESKTYGNIFISYRRVDTSKINKTLWTQIEVN